MAMNCTSVNGSEVPSSCNTGNVDKTKIITCSFVLGVIALVALIGNSLVCLVILKNRKMRTVTNAFLLNLAITDILFNVFTVPGLIVMILYDSWPLGEGLCKAMPFLNTVTLSASIYTMAALAIDRYNAIVHPLKAKVAHTFRRTTILIVVIWMLSAVVSFPQILTFSQVKYNNIKSCALDWTSLNGKLGQRIYGVTTFIILFAIPITIISVAYTTIIKRLTTTDSILSEAVQLNQESRSSSGGCKSPTNEKTDKSKSISRSNRKTTMMMLTVIIAFLVCMLPISVLNLVQPFLVEGSHDPYAIYDAWLMLIILSACASACNPIIYNFFSVKFRKAFADVFRCRCSSNGQEKANDTLLIQSSFRTKRSSIL